MIRGGRGGEEGDGRVLAKEERGVEIGRLGSFAGGEGGEQATLGEGQGSAGAQEADGNGGEVGGGADFVRDSAVADAIERLAAAGRVGGVVADGVFSGGGGDGVEEELARGRRIGGGGNAGWGTGRGGWGGRGEEAEGGGPIAQAGEEIGQFLEERGGERDFGGELEGFGGEVSGGFDFASVEGVAEEEDEEGEALVGGHHGAGGGRGVEEGLFGLSEEQGVGEDFGQLSQEGGALDGVGEGLNGLEGGVEGEGGGLGARSAAVGVGQLEEGVDLVGAGRGGLPFLLEFGQDGGSLAQGDVRLEGFEFDLAAQSGVGDLGGHRGGIRGRGIAPAEADAEEVEPEFPLSGGGEAADGFEGLLGAVGDGEVDPGPSQFGKEGGALGGGQGRQGRFQFGEQGAGGLLIVGFREAPGQAGAQQGGFGFGHDDVGEAQHGDLEEDFLLHAGAQGVVADAVAHGQGLAEVFGVLMELSLGELANGAGLDEGVGDAGGGFEAFGDHGQPGLEDGGLHEVEVDHEALRGQIEARFGEGAGHQLSRAVGLPGFAGGAEPPIEKAEAEERGQGQSEPTFAFFGVEGVAHRTKSSGALSSA